MCLLPRQVRDSSDRERSLITLLSRFLFALRIGQLPDIHMSPRLGDGIGQDLHEIGRCAEPRHERSGCLGRAEVVEELRSGKFKNIAERSGRAQDKEDGGGLETLRREGYM